MKKFGDIITMKLQITANDSILSFQINNDKKEFIVRGITKDKKLNYRLAIGITSGSRSLQLI